MVVEVKNQSLEHFSVFVKDIQDKTYFLKNIGA